MITNRISHLYAGHNVITGNCYNLAFDDKMGCIWARFCVAFCLKIGETKKA